MVIPLPWQPIHQTDSATQTLWPVLYTLKGPGQLKSALIMLITRRLQPLHSSTLIYWSCLTQDLLIAITLWMVVLAHSHVSPDLTMTQSLNHHMPLHDINQFNHLNAALKPSHDINQYNYLNVAFKTSKILSRKSYHTLKSKCQF